MLNYLGDSKLTWLQSNVRVFIAGIKKLPNFNAAGDKAFQRRFYLISLKKECGDDLIQVDGRVLNFQLTEVFRKFYSNLVYIGCGEICAKLLLYVIS
jgi:hypothetical protein